MPRGSVRGSRQGEDHGCKREPHDSGTESPDRGHQWWGRKRPPAQSL